PIKRSSGFAIGRSKRATPAMRSKPGWQPLLVFATGKRSSLSSQGHRRVSTSFTRSTAPRRLKLALARSVRSVALGMLVSFCVTGLALGKDEDDGEEDTTKPKPALPNVYLDMRTIYSTLPAGTLSIGFSAPPLLATLANLSALRTLNSPSSQSVSIYLPLAVDVNDQLSVYGGVSGATSQAGTDPWTAFSIFSFTLGFQADIYQQNGGMFPTITVQSNVSRSTSDSPLASTTYNTILEAGYALNADETRGLLAGMQYAKVLVDTPLARVSPDVMGYVGGYYQWDNNWKFTGRFR